MKHLKKFFERVDESDLLLILDILDQSFETTVKVWENDFIKFADGLLVVNFEETNLPNEKDIKDCDKRLNALGYNLISYDKDLDDPEVFLLIISDELLDNYKKELHFKFIEEIKMQKKFPNWHSSKIEYPDGSNISVVFTNIWSISDSVTDTEEICTNKVIANIEFLRAQHRVRGFNRLFNKNF